jgi:hypothetical protein
MATARATADRPRFRRFFQWRLRTMLLGLMLPAALLAGWLAPYLHERQVIGRLRKLGATVTTVPAGPAFLQRLSDDPPIQHVTRISFERADRTKIGDEQLAGIEHCRSLEQIDLEGCRIGAQTLERLSGLPKLWQVGIAKTGISIGTAAIFAARKPHVPLREEIGFSLFRATQAAFDAETITLHQMLEAVRLATRWHVAVAEQRKDRSARLGALERQSDQLDRLVKMIHALNLAGAKGGEADRLETAQLAAARAELDLAIARGERSTIGARRAKIAGLCRSWLGPSRRLPVEYHYYAEQVLANVRVASELLLDEARAKGDRASEIEIHRQSITQLEWLASAIAQVQRSAGAYDTALVPRAEMRLAEARAVLAHLKGDPRGVDLWADEALAAAELLKARSAELVDSEVYSPWYGIHDHQRGHETALRLAELRNRPQDAQSARKAWRAYLRDVQRKVGSLYLWSSHGGEADIWAYLLCLEAIERLKDDPDTFLNSSLHAFADPEAAMESRLASSPRPPGKIEPPVPMPQLEN